MSRSFFDGGSSLWKPLGYLADIFLLSLLWILCCLPIVTIGPATAALYDSVARGLKAQEPFPYSRFLRRFREGLLSACLSSLLWGGILLLIFFISRSLIAFSGLSALCYTLAAAARILLLLPVGTGLWVFPLHSRFCFSFAALHKTALRLSLSKPLISLALALSFYASLWLCLRYIVPVFILPALLMLLWSLLLEPVFLKYDTDF